MIKEIRVEGFQSLYDVKIELGQFTVVYGESDVGKSAFYRAIRAFFTTETGDDFISTGAKLSRVTITTDDNGYFSWEKRRGKSSYYAQGQMGGENLSLWQGCKTPPLEIIKVLKIAPIIVDGEKFYPNFRGQFDSLFMLFDSSSRRARLLGSLISNVLLRGIKQANLERNRTEADIRAVSDLMAGIDKREHYDWDSLFASIRASQQILDTIAKMQEIYDSLSKLYEKYLSLRKVVGLRIELLQPEWIEGTKQIGSIYYKLYELRSEGIAGRACLGQLVLQAESSGVFLARIKTEIDRAKKDMTIPCPHCGKPVALWEVLK